MIAVAVLVLLFTAEEAVPATKIVFELGATGTYAIGEQPSCGETPAGAVRERYRHVHQ